MSENTDLSTFTFFVEVNELMIKGINWSLIIERIYRIHSI